MADDLKQFLDEVRAESEAAGPEAVAELEAYRRHFELTRQLHELRVARGLSQAELSRRSGVQQSEISRIEHGRGNPTYQTLAALAGALRSRIAFVPATETTVRAKRATVTRTHAERKPSSRAYSRSAVYAKR